MRADSIHIRKAVDKDITAITEIYNLVIKEGGYTADLDTYSVDERQAWFDQHSVEPYNIFIIEKNAEILGYFYFSPWRPRRTALNGVAEISFFLDKQARGKGLGDLIMERSIHLAKERGLSHLLAILLDINSRSAGLLRKWGFQVAGELPGIVNMPGKTAGQLIMLRSLETI